MAIGVRQRKANKVDGDWRGRRPSGGEGINVRIQFFARRVEDGLNVFGSSSVYFTPHVVLRKVGYFGKTAVFPKFSLFQERSAFYKNIRDSGILLSCRNYALFRENWIIPVIGGYYR
jgi:hypothetical protein